MHRATWLAGIAVLVTLGMAPAPAQQSDTWRGTIDLSSAGQGKLEFFVTFTTSPGGVAARVSIPAQGAKDLPATDVQYDDTTIRFTLPVQPPAVFHATRQGDSAAGTLTQGARLPIELHRLAKDEAGTPKRPQTPKPPFSYEAREVRYANPVDGTELAGTLTLPRGEGPFPAVLLLTGSGAQDRDETIFGHKPFWVLADYLTRHGIAVLRSDDRGVGGSTGSMATSTTMDFAGDALAGVEFLRAQPEIAAGRVGLLGHSEGGVVAMLAASHDEDVAFIVTLAGPGLSGRDLLPLQLAAINRAAGVEQQVIQAQVSAQKALIDAVMEQADEATIRARAERLVDLQLANVPEAQRRQARDVAVTQAVQQLASPWYRAFLRLDPREILRTVHCPVLAVNGTLDRQVPARDNLEAIANALAQAGNDDVSIVPLEGLNHLLQHAKSGLVSEYGLIEETIAPEALRTVSEWIHAHVGTDLVP